MSCVELSDPKSIALFCDFDGTLVEIAEGPDAVTLHRSTLAAIGTLVRELDGAVAIVTGRDISIVDRFLAPLRLPIAGVHGLIRRDAEGNLHAGTSHGEALCASAAHLDAFAAGRAGVLVERKSGSIALHYRARPELEADCVRAIEDAVRDIPGIRIKRGKMVLEARPDSADKGTAVAAFMAEAPFRGRRPVFAGDDETDEDAFAEVNARNGISIKVGDGATVARHRFDRTESFLAWLEAIASGFDREGGR